MALGEIVLRVCFLDLFSIFTEMLLVGRSGDKSRFLGVCRAYVMYIARDRKDSADG